MIKIGYIDYFLDEWHADNYVNWIAEAGEGEYEVAYAYAEIEPPGEDKRSNAAFCRDHGIQLIDTIEELIELSDAIIVLAPDNPETHVRLSESALRSGKPVYIDKTFAETTAEAEQMFELAEKHETPMFSTSALRYSGAYQDLPDKRVHTAILTGGGSPSNYIIHQLEPLIMLLKSDVKRALAWGDAGTYTFLLDLASGQRVTLNQSPDLGFSMMLDYGDETIRAVPEDEFFRSLIKDMLRFFKENLEGERYLPVPREETVAIIRARELILKAMKHPGTWIEGT